MLSVLLVDYLPEKRPSAKPIVDIVIRPGLWLGKNPLVIYLLMTVVSGLLKNLIVIDDRSLWIRIIEDIF